MDEVEYEDYEGEDTTQEGDVLEGEHGDEQMLALDLHPQGLKEISNLGKFTVSTHKQDNGVDELKCDDLTKFWQSDGTQPHNLTVYFVKKVAIREIRFYVDYEQDESYTPTRIVFRSGTSENNLMQFSSMDLEHPKGWQKVPIDGVGGGLDGNTLYSWVFQMSVTENHQNGKDTHLRSIKIFAPDMDSSSGGTTSEKLPTKAPWIMESLLEHGPQPFWGPPPYRNPGHDSFGHDTPELRDSYPDYYEPELMWPPVYGPWPLRHISSSRDARNSTNDVPINSLLQSDDETPTLPATSRRVRPSHSTLTNAPATQPDDVRSAAVETLLEAFDGLDLPDYLREPELR